MPLFIRWFLDNFPIGKGLWWSNKRDHFKGEGIWVLYWFCLCLLVWWIFGVEFSLESCLFSVIVLIIVFISWISMLISFISWVITSGFIPVWLLSYAWCPCWFVFGVYLFNITEYFTASIIFLASWKVMFLVYIILDASLSLFQTSPSSEFAGWYFCSSWRIPLFDRPCVFCCFRHIFHILGV